MKKWILVLLLFKTCIINVSAQSNLTVNVSNPYAYDNALHSPAGISFLQRIHGTAGIQFLFTGLSNDNLRSNIGYFVHPLGLNSAIGLRVDYFTADLVQQGNFSILFGHKFFEDKIGFGLNTNLLTYSYNTEKFQLIDPGDPLIQRGTSKNAFSFGVGVIYRPSEIISLGASIDHLNRPDISIDDPAFKKDPVYKFGLTVNKQLLALQIELIKDHGDVMFQGAIRRNFLDQKFEVLGGYDFLGSESNNIFTELIYYSGEIGISYNLKYPLNDLNQVTNGTHRFSLLFNWGPGKALVSMPEIAFISRQQKVIDSTIYRLLAKVSDEVGLKTVQVHLNGKELKEYSYPNRDKHVNIDLNIELNEGKNVIELIALNGKKKSVETAVIEVLRPTPPTITIVEPSEGRTTSGRIKLELLIDSPDTLISILVIVNGDTLKDLKKKGLLVKERFKKKFRFAREIKLQEGTNSIEILAANRVGLSRRDLGVFYDAPPPIGYRKTWAVIIGINNYLDSEVASLDSAVSDAQKVEKILREKFDFDHIITLYDENATKSRIIAALSDSLRKTQPEDGVFIYFAGHGDTERTPQGALGYIIPYDGAWKSYQSNISMGVIRETSRIPKARHIFYVVDSCFSGLLLVAKGVAGQPIPSPVYDFFLQDSRYVLTAGRQGERAIDGLFARRLVEGLNGFADFDKDGFITSRELSIYVSQKVMLDARILNHVQTPQFGQIIPDDGEFIFVRKEIVGKY